MVYLQRIPLHLLERKQDFEMTTNIPVYVFVYTSTAWTCHLSSSRFATFASLVIQKQMEISPVVEKLLICLLTQVILNVI